MCVCFVPVASLLQRIVAEHFPSASASAEASAEASAASAGAAGVSLPLPGDRSCSGAWIGAESLDWAELAATTTATMDSQPCHQPEHEHEDDEAARPASLSSSLSLRGGWDVVLISDCVYEPLYGESWVRRAHTSALVVL